MPFFASDEIFPPPAQDPVGYDVVLRFWHDTISLIATRSDPPILPPGNRREHDDFVSKGLRMPVIDVIRAKAHWKQFIERAGQYPVSSYSGRGIVMLGGNVSQSVILFQLLYWSDHPENSQLRITKHTVDRLKVSPKIKFSFENNITVQSEYVLFLNSGSHCRVLASYEHVFWYCNDTNLGVI